MNTVLLRVVEQNPVILLLNDQTYLKAVKHRAMHWGQFGGGGTCLRVVKQLWSEHKGKVHDLSV